MKIQIPKRTWKPKNVSAKEMREWLKEKRRQIKLDDEYEKNLEHAKAITIKEARGEAIKKLNARYKVERALENL